MQTLPNNPLLTEEEVGGATGDPSAPVGLGAFKFVEYTPGNGNSFIAERNEDYWRGDGPDSVTGEGLPYLDEIEFVVAVDIQGRSSGLQSGQFDIIHTANSDEIAKFEGDEEYTLLQANDFGETNYILLNVAQGENPTLAFVRGIDSLDMDPGGLNAANPLVHLSCRTALAHAVDRQRLADERGAGIVTPANGPFPPGSIGYLEDSGYPEFDLEAAATAWEECKTDAGTTPISFTFNTTNDAFNVETNELVASMWTDAFGEEIAVSIAPIEQGQYINLALAGAFQAQAWRNHGGVDPTEQWYWWSSATASPINPSVPELALNFGRFQDPAMDEQMGIVQQNPDPAARQAAAEEVNRLFGENVWNLWTTWTLWGVVANPRVQDITNLEIPDFGPAMPVVAGKHQLAQIWCSEGDCQG
jgi:peptide/nickel transport system substrate-binding protein